VNYTGWLYDPTKTDFKGIQFDSTAASGPFTFTLGAGSVIKGWDDGLVGLRVGGIRQLVIPPSLAYGNVRNNAIPPNTALVFEVELLSIQ
jgi:FKBP-type peptidyl-prolyl cis-trans isomerase